MDQMSGEEKFQWIMRCGWKGLCPHCGKGHMFTSYLKLAKTCDNCGLNYKFAAPDDGPAFFVQCIIAFPLVFLLVWLQVAYNPPWWVLVFIGLPILLIACLLPLRPIKGWLVASQFVNRAQEFGTQNLWTELNAREEQDEIERRK